MKNKKKGLLHIIVILAVIALCSFTTLVGFTKAHKGSARNIKLGLDLAGGVSITYDVVGDKPTDAELKDTVTMMQKRAEVHSTESSVVTDEKGRIVIDIPGVDDAEKVLSDLGKEGSLDFVAQDDMDLSSGKPVYTKTICTGKDIKSAEAGTTQEESTKTKQYVVSLKFKSKGTKAFATATEEAAPSHKMIYIVYDGKVISNPGVTEAITNGEAQISGGFKTYDEAEELASYIRIGALPVELKAAQSQVVGAQLGLDAIQSSLLAGAIGFGLVVLFMIIFYRLPGLASSIAMAVDANVIIFTRIKEELAKGKSVQSGIKIGFDKALSAIIDGNVTTLIAAAVLYVKGSGTVKGFATTLALGIILSMFTALVITKLLLNAMYSLGMDDVKYFGVEKPRKPIHFVENRLKFFCISGAIILACVVTLGVNKASRCGGNILNYGLDFLGGTTYDITFPDKTDLNADLKSDLEKLFSKTAKSNDVVISEVAGRNALSVKTVELNEKQRNTLNETLEKTYGVDEKNIENQNISASVSDDMKSDAVTAVVIAVICMLIYIWFRFKDVIFAGSAVLALIHDVIAVILVYGLTKISVGNTFIACMLTIVGYSINATIVIFDRIRENLQVHSSEEALAEVVNESITQTLTRSINTSLTTIITVVVLAILGVDSVKDFAIPLLAGFICGGYSSVCITGTLWYSWKRVQFKRKKAKK